MKTTARIILVSISFFGIIATLFGGAYLISETKNTWACAPWTLTTGMVLCLFMAIGVGTILEWTDDRSKQ